MNLQAYDWFISFLLQLTRVKKDTELEKWFTKLAKSILALKYHTSNHSKTGRKIQLMLEALVNVEQFEEIDTSLQIKEFLQHSRDFLMNMVRMGHITDKTLTTLDQVCDVTPTLLPTPKKSGQ